MEKFTFTPKGVCSTKMEFEINDNKLENFQVIGGCAGNLIGIKNLIEGKDINEIVDTLEGIPCRHRNTSCPDQIAQGLKKYLNK